MSNSDQIAQIVAEAMRSSRDSALTSAIEICKMFAEDGHNAVCCVRALEDFKRMIGDTAPPPSGMN